MYVQRRHSVGGDIWVRETSVTECTIDVERVDKLA
jgi:hypothetical protein